MTNKISGKKAIGTSAAASTADATAAGDLKKVHDDWQRSSLTERQLDALCHDG